MRILISTLLVLLVSSCGLIPQRDFFFQMEEAQDPMFRPREDFQVVSGDTGDTMDTIDHYMKRVPANDVMMRKRVRSASLSQELRDLEDRLTEKEYNYYIENEHNLIGVSEKIYFLRMSSLEDRERYIENRGYRKSRLLKDTQAVTPLDNLYSGMSKSEVMRKFGQPISRDIAGNSENENERWSYRTGNKVRYIYFESGRVDGWESTTY